MERQLAMTASLVLVAALVSACDSDDPGTAADTDDALDAADTALGPDTDTSDAPPGDAAQADGEVDNESDGDASDSGSDDDTSDAEPADTREADSDPDTGPSCADVTCDLFESCLAGACVAYPDCLEGETCAGEEDVCRSDFCVPGDVDIDGDGAIASDDCDETNPAIRPGADEVCNGLDDDCIDGPDDGDPVSLCAGSGTGDLCLEGSCGCVEGAFDFDPEASGCECLAVPSLDQGSSCAESIDLGDVTDTAQVAIVSGVLVPEGREVWYRFRGVDSSDTACDNYHVRVRFQSDPDGAYEFTVCRGGCGMNCFLDVLDYTWATDFRKNIDGRLEGECPCIAPGAPPVQDVDRCEDDTAYYFVRVERRPEAPVMCSPYSLEISNGLYDTP